MDYGGEISAAPARLSACGTLPKASEHPGHVLFDLHASHRTDDSVIISLAKRGWRCVGGSTDDVQITDAHVNRPFKHAVSQLYKSQNRQ